MNMSRQAALVERLPQLQSLIKQDPDAVRCAHLPAHLSPYNRSDVGSCTRCAQYRDEFLLQLRRFTSELELFALKPDRK